MAGATGGPSQKRSRPDESYQDFIRVRGCFGDPMEIVLSQNQALPLSVLQSAFSESCGLCYVNPDTMSRRIVNYDGQMKCFLPPDDGWSSEIVYQVVYKDSRSVSPYLRVESPLPELDEIEKFCFYILNIDEKTKKETKSSVFCIDSFYFATYQHTSKTVYKINETKVKVFSLDGKEVFDTIAKHVNVEQDYVLLKSDRQIFNRGPTICEFSCSGSIILCGCFSGEVEPHKAVKKSGCLQSSKTAFIKCGNDRRGPYLFGNVTAAGGDSGCAVFCPHGCKGMNVGVSNFPDYSYKVAFGKSAVYHPICMIVPAVDMTNVISYMETEETKKAIAHAEVDAQFDT